MEFAVETEFLVQSPSWFHGLDIVLDVLGIVILLVLGLKMLAFSAVENVNKKHSLFSLGFFFLALSLIVKDVIYGFLYYVGPSSLATNSYHSLWSLFESENAYLIFGVFMFKLLALIGVYLLHKVYYPELRGPVSSFALYLIVLTMILSLFIPSMFHFTKVFFLISITIKCGHNWNTKKNLNCGMIFVGFMLLTLSSLIFAAENVHGLFYLLGEVIQVLSYIMLLIPVIRVYYHGTKKTKQSRYCI